MEQYTKYGARNCQFITKLTRVAPEIKDEELFQEAVHLLLYEYEKVFACISIDHTEALIGFLERQDSLSGRGRKEFKLEETARDKDRNPNQERSNNQDKQITDNLRNINGYSEFQGRNKDWDNKKISRSRIEDNRRRSWYDQGSEQVNLCLGTSNQNQTSTIIHSSINKHREVLDRNEPGDKNL